MTENPDMTETAILSFIIRLWREDAEESGGHSWRGHITHVPGNERRYFEDLTGILQFIEPFLSGRDPETQFE